MTLPTCLRAALSLGLVAMLCACGGESGRTDSATASAQAAPAMAATPAQGSAASLKVRLRALGAGGGSSGAAAGPITNDQFFQWAALILPSEFPASPVPKWLVAENLVWDVRAYANGNYLGVAGNGRAYALGPVTGNVLVDLGPMQAFADQVCSMINCAGAGGTGVSNSFLCGIPLPSVPPGYGEVCARPPGVGRLEGQVLPDTVCLGTRDCPRIEASVSLRTADNYKGSLTGTLLYCDGNPGQETNPQCRPPTSNDLGHLGMIAFRFNAPNGGVGPRTSVTFQVLTSTDGVGLNRCSRLGDPPYSIDSDANTLRISDESGTNLYIRIRTTGTSCSTN